MQLVGLAIDGMDMLEKSAFQGADAFASRRTAANDQSSGEDVGARSILGLGQLLFPWNPQKWNNNNDGK